MTLTEKQKEVLTGSKSRINLYYGSVRSGKTILSILWWCAFVRSKPISSNFLMVGKTLTTLKNNILVEMQKLDPSFEFSISSKKATLYGRSIWLEGANDERSENKIRGMTLVGAYIDELTLIPESFYNMVLSRLSEKGAKLIATTNPDSPTNYVYTNIICNNEISKAIYKFHLLDNTFLDKDYVEQIQKEYTGVYKQRFIDGDFVRAEGTIFLDFADNPQKYIIPFADVPKRFKGTYMGYDLGGHNSAYALVSIGLGYDGVVYVQKAKKIKAGQLKTADVDTNAIEFINYVESKYNTQIERCGVDDAYYTTINDLNAWRYMFYNAAEVKGSMPLYDRPMLLSKLMAQGRFKLVEGECDDLADELKNMVFDDKADKDVPLDDGTMQIDCYDGLLYALAPVYHYLKG